MTREELHRSLRERVPSLTPSQREQVCDAVLAVIAAATADISQNRIDKSRLAELERGWKHISEYIDCLPEEDVPQLVFYRLGEKDAEIAELKSKLKAALQSTLTK